MELHYLSRTNAQEAQRQARRAALIREARAAQSRADANPRQQRPFWQQAFRAALAIPRSPM